MTLRCPFTTETVSMVPVPLGPSTVSVLSGLNSLRDWWSRSGRSQGIGVRRAPPRDSSLPRFEAATEEEEMDEEGVETEVVPFSRPLPGGRKACGNGKASVLLDTDRTRSRAWRYGGRKR